MANLSCGQGGSTGAEIIQRINELTKLDPSGAMNLTVTKEQTFTDDEEPILITAFDNITIERTGIAVDASVNYSITNNTGHSFDKALIHVGFNIEFPAGESLETYAYINGVRVPNSLFVIQGEGNGKPISAYWSAILAIPQGFAVDIRGRNADGGSFTCNFLNSVLHLDCDWKETLQD